jgi:hypothetical protein
MSFETGEVRQLTAPEGTRPDRAAVFAPDGHALAFVSGGHLAMLPISPSLQAAGKAVEWPVTREVQIGIVGWSADSRDIILSMGQWRELAALANRGASRLPPRTDPRSRDRRNDARRFEARQSSSICTIFAGVEHLATGTRRKWAREGIRGSRIRFNEERDLPGVLAGWEPSGI